MMIFASLSVAYADVAIYPRSRPQPEIPQPVTATVTSDKRLVLRFTFPAPCDYKYQLIDNRTGEEIHSGKGSCENGNALEILNLNNRIKVGENHFRLKIHAHKFKEQTRFGTKIKRGEMDLIKNIVLTRGDTGRVSVDIYDD